MTPEYDFLLTTELEGVKLCQDMPALLMIENSPSNLSDVTWSLTPRGVELDPDKLLTQSVSLQLNLLMWPLENEDTYSYNYNPHT